MRQQWKRLTPQHPTTDQRLLLQLFPHLRQMTCTEAYFQLNPCGCDSRDEDNDLTV
jgi:hypothetical protein